MDFVKIYNVIPSEVCDEILAEVNQNHEWQKHTYNPTFKRPTGTHFPPTEFEFMDSTREQSLQIMPYVEKVMRQYNQYINETNSFPGYDASTGVASCTPIRFNRCKTHTLVETHHDHIQELFGPGNTSIPSVSVVGLLNEEFTGGEFVLFKDTVIPLKKGDILLFPSTYLYPHRVDKVKSGVRNSFVTWAF
jgi:predicted 2-oxoglutarate/Fe(II)-dependent dioxygenase YbiX